MAHARSLRIFTNRGLRLSSISVTMGFVAAARRDRLRLCEARRRGGSTIYQYTSSSCFSKDAQEHSAKEASRQSCHTRLQPSYMMKWSLTHIW